MLLGIRRAAIVAVLLLGYLYFHLAGEAYALVSIGLISFAAVAQFAPAMLGGMYWKGGTRGGALAGPAARLRALGLHADAAVDRQVGLVADRLLSRTGRAASRLLKPEQLFGLAGLDSLTHSLFWSLLANVGAYVVVSLARTPSARETSQALLFVDVFRAPRTAAASTARCSGVAVPRWPSCCRWPAASSAWPAARRLFDDYARRVGVAHIEQIPPDARLVQFVETQLAGAIGSASARVMVASVVEEEALELDDVMRILDEASQLRAYSRELEEKSLSLRARDR